MKTVSGSVAIDKAIAGFTAGAVSTCILHPLDLIKTRFQGSIHVTIVNETSANKMGATWRTIRQIYRNEGLLALYRGLSANMAGSCASWGLYFLIYQSLKDSKRPEKGHLTAEQHLIASAQAGALTSLMTNPLWVIKTRMCATRANDPNAYTGLVDGLQKTWKGEGLGGLYKGFIPALFGVSHGAIQFMVYEELKKEMAGQHRNTENLTILEYLGMAVCSKTVATVCTYPYQLVRARLQNRTENQSIIYLIKSIYNREGGKALYKGLGPNLVRVMPGTALTFLVYESMGKLFQTI